MRRAWQTYVEQGLDHALDYFAEDCEIEDFPEMVDRATYVGRDGIRERTGHFEEAWGNFAMDPVEFIDAGPTQVIAVVALTVEGAESRTPLDGLAAFVYELKEGKIVRDRAFRSKSEAMRAAGLRGSVTAERASAPDTVREIEGRDEEVIARLRRVYEAFSRGDFDSAIEIAHPDVELITTGGLTNLRGADKLRDWMEPVTLENVVMDPFQFEVAGDSVLVHQRSRGRGVESGVDVEMNFWVVWTIDDEGLVTRVVAFNDDQEARARAAAGLSE